MVPNQGVAGLGPEPGARLVGLGQLDRAVPVPQCGVDLPETGEGPCERGQQPDLRRPHGPLGERAFEVADGHVQCPGAHGRLALLPEPGPGVGVLAGQGLEQVGGDDRPRCPTTGQDPCGARMQVGDLVGAAPGQDDVGDQRVPGGQAAMVQGKDLGSHQGRDVVGDDVQRQMGELGDRPDAGLRAQDADRAGGVPGGAGKPAQPTRD